MSILNHENMENSLSLFGKPEKELGFQCRIASWISSSATVQNFIARY